MTNAATEHFRQIFDRRTPEQLRTLSHVKRFMERLAGDLDFRKALSENVDFPRVVTDRYGIEVDPMKMLPLWHRRLPETPLQPGVQAVAPRDDVGRVSLRDVAAPRSPARTGRNVDD
ncbi:hypothetical protein ACVW16_004892 [Bradyrhizobium sp. USDA 4474]